jgi:hypothetical protein
MKIIATITFLRGTETTSDWRPRSGIRPQLKIKDIFTSCTVWADKKEDLIFEPGIEYKVNLEPHFLEKVKPEIYVGMPVQLNDGSRIVATGTIIETK